MSLEFWNTAATLGTFLVISATAIAAMVQLRHVRRSNQIAAFTELRQAHERPEFLEAQHYLLVRLERALAEPEFRYQIANRAARSSEAQHDIAKIEIVGNFYEAMGTLVKTGLVDQRIVMEIWSELVTIVWEKLAPVTAILRREGGSGLWENFEYLVVLSQDWLTAHPDGTYPAGVRRIKLEDRWREADTRYESELRKDAIDRS